jgi:DNA repair exonuclease SbcCD ATPase subunit
MYELNPLMESVIKGYFNIDQEKGKTVVEKGWDSFTEDEKQKILKNLGYGNIEELQQKIKDLQNLITQILTTVNKDTGDITQKLQKLLSIQKGGGYMNKKMFIEEDTIEEIHNKLNNGYTLTGGYYTNLNEINNSLKKSNSYIMDTLDLIYGGAIDVNDTIKGIDGLEGLVGTYNKNIEEINNGIDSLIARHKDEVDRLQGELDKIKASGDASTTELNNTIEELQKEVERLTAENNKLKNSLSSGTDASAALQGLLDTANSRIEELNKEITSLKDQLAQKEKQNNQKQEELTEVSKNVDNYKNLLSSLMKTVSEDTTAIRAKLPQPTVGGTVRTREDDLLSKLRGVVNKMTQTPKAMVGGGSSNLLKEKYAEIKSLHRQNKALRQNIMVGGSYEQSLMVNNQLYNNYNQIRQNSVDMMSILQGMQQNPQFNKNLNMNLQNALIRGDPVAQQVQGQLDPSSMQRLAGMLGL